MGIPTFSLRVGVENGLKASGTRAGEGYDAVRLSPKTSRERVEYPSNRAILAGKDLVKEKSPSGYAGKSTVSVGMNS